MHLVDAARAHIEERTQRSFKERALRSMLAFVLPYPMRFRLALKAAGLGRPLIPLFERFGLKEVAAMLALAPKEGISREGRFRGAGTAVTHSERRARVILMTGCVQPVLRPDINDATIRLLARRGVDVIVSHGAGCWARWCIISARRRRRISTRAATSMPGRRRWSGAKWMRSSSTPRVAGRR